MSRVAPTLFCLFAALAACKGHSDAEPAPIAGLSAPAGSNGAAPRRPTRRYYMARRGDTCEVYSVDGDRISPTVRAPCPMDLNNGERIRLVGKTCAREASGDREREQPVVCPDPLTNVEKRDLAALAASASASSREPIPPLPPGEGDGG